MNKSSKITHAVHTYMYVHIYTCTDMCIKQEHGYKNEKIGH